MIGRRALKSNLEGYAFLFPALLFYGCFILFPLFNVFKSSLYKINTLSQKSTFIGFNNFTKLAQDPIFWRALINTTIYTISIIVLINFCAIVFAIIIDRGKIKGNYLI